jgi:hypothetical protein
VAEIQDVDAAVRRIEALVEAQPESAELVQLLMQVYGEGLSRVLEIARAESGAAFIDRLAEDKVVASLLLLHGLHPVDPETRLRKALAKLDRRLEAQQLVLAEMRDGVAVIRVEHNGGGSPPPALAEMIERAALDAAPDLKAIEIEGAPLSVALVQIAPVRSV